MNHFKLRSGSRIGRRTVVVVGCALVAVLISTTLLMYYDVFTPVPLPDAADIRIPTLAASRPAADRLPAGPLVVDANYKRAVASQLAQIGEREGIPRSVPASTAEQPPMRRPAVPTPEVTVAVDTVDVPLNVRAQPGISAPVIGSLAPGTSLAAIGRNRDGSWILAHIPHREEPGWIFAGLVRVTAGDLATLRQVETDLSRE